MKFIIHLWEVKARLCGSSTDCRTFSSWGAPHTTARALLTELWDNRRVSLSTQVLQEFYAVVTRKFRPPMPRAQARAIVAAYGEWCDVATEPQLIVAASRLEG